MTCDWCESTESITRIQAAYACVDHIDKAMDLAFQPIKTIIGNLDVIKP